MVKPGIREMLRRDAILLRLLGHASCRLGRAALQAEQVVDEFVEYTLREVDLRREADNAETFAANFRDLPDIVFPKIYRELSGPRRAVAWSSSTAASPGRGGDAEPEDRARPLVDLGAAAIIRMLYRDGFFHADLHPGNLMILPGPKVGFIDLGMVGRFDEELRRTLMYYYYCLVTGDCRERRALPRRPSREPGRGATRTASAARSRTICAALGADRELQRVLARPPDPRVGDARARYRMYFPVEMVLMVKALVTFEGVGQMLQPGFDVAEVSQRHIRDDLPPAVQPAAHAREGLRGAPTWWMRWCRRRCW